MALGYGEQTNSSPTCADSASSLTPRSCVPAGQQGVTNSSHDNRVAYALSRSQLVDRRPARRRWKCRRPWPPPPYTRPSRPPPPEPPARPPPPAARVAPPARRRRPAAAAAAPPPRRRRPPPTRYNTSRCPVRPAQPPRPWLPQLVTSKISSTPPDRGPFLGSAR